jgi:hypothetical protein
MAEAKKKYDNLVDPLNKYKNGLENSGDKHDKLDKYPTHDYGLDPAQKDKKYALESEINDLK